MTMVVDLDLGLVVDLTYLDLVEVDMVVDLEAQKEDMLKVVL